MASAAASVMLVHVARGQYHLARDQYHPVRSGEVPGVTDASVTKWAAAAAVLDCRIATCAVASHSMHGRLLLHIKGGWAHLELQLGPLAVRLRAVYDANASKEGDAPLVLPPNPLTAGRRRATLECPVATAVAAWSAVRAVSPAAADCVAGGVSAAGGIGAGRRRRRMQQGGPDGDSELGRPSGHPAEGPGVEAAVEALGPPQQPCRVPPWPPAHRRRWVQRRLRTAPPAFTKARRQAA